MNWVDRSEPVWANATFVALGCGVGCVSVAAGDDTESRRRFGVTCGRLLERRAQVPHISLHLEGIADLAPILDPAVARSIVGLAPLERRA